MVTATGAVLANAIQKRGGPRLLSDDILPITDTLLSKPRTPEETLLGGLEDIYHAQMEAADPGYKDRRVLQRMNSIQSTFEERKEALALGEGVPNLLNSRLKYFDERTIELAPALVYKTIARSYPTENDVAKTAASINQIVPWLLEKTSFAGEDGALAAAYAYAVRTENRTGLEILQAIQLLDPLAQRITLEQLRRPSAIIYSEDPADNLSPVGKGGPQLAGYPPPGINSEEIAAFHRGAVLLEEKFGMVLVKDDKGNAYWSLPNEDKSIDLEVSLRALFPQSSAIFNTKIGGDPSAWERYSINPVGALAKGAVRALEIASVPFVIGMEAYKGITRKAAEFGTEIAEELLGEDYTEEEKKNLVAKTAETRVMGIPLNPVELFESGFRDFDNSARWVVRNTLLKLIDTDEQTEADLETAFAGLLEIWILNKAGTASRAFKAARTLPPEIAQGKLGISEAFTETAFGRRILPNNPLAHPLRVAKDVMNRVGFELGSKGTAANAVFNTKFIQESFDAISAINARHPKSKMARIGAIRASTRGTLPMPLIKRLAEVSRSQMEIVWLEYWELSRIVTPEMTAISKRQAGRRKFVKQLTDTKRIEEMTDTLKTLIDEAKFADDVAKTATDATARLKAESARDLSLQRAQEVTQKLLDNANRAIEVRLAQSVDSAAMRKLAGKLDGTPIWEYPRTNVLKRFVIGEVGGRAGTIANSAFVTPLRKLALKTVDDLGRFPKLWAPWGAKERRPADWVEQNVDIMTKYLGRAGVPEPIAFELAGELGLVKTRGDFFAWAEKAAAAIDTALPRSTPNSVRTQLTKWFDRPTEGRGRLGITENSPDARGVIRSSTEPIVPRRDPLNPKAPAVAMPDSPTAMLGHFTLPDVELLIDATSGLRRAVRAAGRHRYRRGGLAVEALYHGGKGILGFGTAALKAPILVLRLPALMQRIQLEQAIRAHFFGGYKGLLWFPNGLILPTGFLNKFSSKLGGKGKHFGNGLEIIKPDPRYASNKSPWDSDLGSIREQLSYDPVTETYGTQQMHLINARRQMPTEAQITSYVETLQKIRDDYFDKKFTDLGLDVDRMLEYIERNEVFREYVQNEQLPVLRDSELAVSATGEVLSAGAMIRSWLERKAQSFEELYAADPAARQAVISGEYLRGERTRFPETGPNGEPLRQIFDEKLEELQSIQTRVRELQRESNLGQLGPEQNALLVTLQREAHTLRGETRALRDRIDIDTPGAASVRLADTADVGVQVRTSYDQGVLNFPSELKVKQRYDWSTRKGIVEGGRNFRRAWNNAWYATFRPLTWADMVGTRGSVYHQMTKGYYDGLIKRGYSEPLARAHAQVKAASSTRDLMYDLSARSSFQRSLKDTFWFAPAAQEILYTWAVKIPSQYAYGTGFFIIPAKAKAFLNVLRGTGIIQKITDRDGKTEEVIMVPGLAAFVDKMVGIDFNPQISANIRGFNLVASNPFSAGGLATFPSIALGKASREWGNVFKTLSDFFNQYGAEVTGWPRQIPLAWEALTGNPWPLEYANPDFAKAQYDRSMDQALQFAFTELMANGDKPPRPENFATPELYEDARDEYQERLFGEAESYFKGIAWVRLAGASVTPAAIYPSEKERSDMNKLWKAVDLAGNEEETGRYSQRQKNMIDTYVAKHPNSLAYTIGYTVYGEKEKELPYSSTGDEAFFDEFFTGERRVLTPEEYAQKLVSVESYRFYLAQKNAALKEIGSDAPSLLSKGFERVEVLRQFTERWNDWLLYNEDARHELETSQEAWRERYGIPSNTYEVERLSTTIELLNELSPYFTGESGIRSEEYRAILGELKSMYSDTASFGEPSTQIGKDMAWYYDNVLDSYFSKTEALYEKANELTAKGADASGVYDEIRAINNSYDDAQLTHRGLVFPTPEEVFFGNKNPAEQEYALLNWTTKPPSWLSDFQLDKVGIVPEFEGRNELISRITAFDDQLSQFLLDENVSSSSDYYDQLQIWAKRERTEIAIEYGDSGEQFLDVYNMTPAQRLDEADYGEGNTNWMQVNGAAADIIARLEENELSPRGWGELAKNYKTWLFTVIEQRREADSAYDQLWEALSYSIPERGLEQREGVPLYDAVLFGNFNTSFIPQDALQTIYFGGTV